MGKRGRAEEGLRVIDEAFAVVSRNGELAWEAELWRVKGELLLQAVQRLQVQVRLHGAHRP